MLASNRYLGTLLPWVSAACVLAAWRLAFLSATGASSAGEGMLPHCLAVLLSLVTATGVSAAGEGMLPQCPAVLLSSYRYQCFFCW